MSYSFQKNRERPSPLRESREGSGGKVRRSTNGHVVDGVLARLHHLKIAAPRRSGLEALCVIGKLEPTKMHISRQYFSLRLLLVLAVLVSGCANKEGNSKSRGGDRDVPVATTVAQTGELPIYLTGLGNVKPLNSVTIRPRVDGAIQTIAFTEGQFVNEGDLLVQIDPRPFEVQLKQAEAQLAKDAAVLKNSKLELARQRLAAEAIPKQQIDTQAALVEQNEAVLKIDQAQIDSASLQLTYSRVTAPLSGKIGLRLVDVGNVVHASDPTGIAVINQVQPITVSFTLPQDVIGALTDGLRAANNKLAVDAFDRELQKKLASGNLLALDNQIDQSSGTLRLKAQFENKDELLFPNQFVNARLLVATLKNAVIVPDAAVQRGPEFNFVYVLKADGTVTMRKVVVGPNEAGNTAISEGLNAGEVVITEGVDKLFEGSKVTTRAPGGDGPKAGEAAKGKEPAPDGAEGKPRHQHKAKAAS